MKEKYKNIYGSEATITETEDGKYELFLTRPEGYSTFKFVCGKIYETYRGAKIAMGKFDHDWRKI